MASHKVLAMLVFAAFAFTSNGREFLRPTKTVNSASVQTELNGVLSEVLGHGHGMMSDRITKIHKTMDPLFRSLPKNNQGHLSASVMRYAVRRYFSQSHGWIVKGFAVHEEAMNTSSAEATDILQTKLPSYIRSMLEERLAHEGFSLDALVAMVAAVERMAFDEVVRGLELAFYFNSFWPMDPNVAMDESDLLAILSSYLLIEMKGDVGNGTPMNEKEKEIHLNMKTRKQRSENWRATLLFLMDTITSDIFHRQAAANPFVDKAYSFEDAVRMAERVSEGFGSWSDHECHTMKDMLMELDVHKTGRVKLADFYTYTKDGAWQFVEPAQELRRGGILDESSSWLGPQVVIPNYITGMNNCITSGPYYSICCLNECDQVFQQLERAIGASHSTASQIIGALENGLYAANISALNRDRLAEIAHANGEKIPIYGRLFTRWLHFVYPQECPYPHGAGDVVQMNPAEWLSMGGSLTTKDEIADHIESKFAHLAPSPDAGASMWSMDEAVLESSTPSDFVPTSGIWVLLRIAAQIVMLVGFLSLFRKPVVQMLRSDAKAKAKPMQYDV